MCGSANCSPLVAAASRRTPEERRLRRRPAARTASPTARTRRSGQRRTAASSSAPASSASAASHGASTKPACTTISRPSGSGGATWTAATTCARPTTTRSVHERIVHELADGTRDDVLFTDDIRCPVHVADLAVALLELASYDVVGIHHLAGPDALSRHELGILIARRDGLDASQLPTGLRAEAALPGALDVRLDSRATQRKLSTTLRGAHQFCTAPA
ncbi:dTDP-4-dehydrorhamnose reductase [Streptomyces mirabilis]|uniref:dTDP-4-dehydrorhamnose reductase n=1 Tax=Streptomyces mirabilis TaxID=68239 RepID=UPI00362EBE3A